MLTYILATVFVLGILILIHELGHFMVAKSVDIRVPRFSIGLGPKLIGIKKGETEYCISAIPFGGYVKMAGEESGEFIEGGGDDEEQEKKEYVPSPRDFDQKSIGARIAVVSAGSVMNYIWGFLLFFLLAYFQGVPYFPVTEMGQLEWGEEGPLEELSELQRGDKIIEVSGVEVDEWGDVLSNIMDEDKSLSLKWTDVEGVVHEARFPSADSELRERLTMALQPEFPARVGEVQSGSPADLAGFLPGDLIVSVSGIKIDSWSTAVRAIKVSPEKELDIEVMRNNSIVAISVVPEKKVLPIDGETYQEVGQIGILSDIPKEELGLLSAIGQGAKESYYVSVYVIMTLKKLITGEISPKMLGGPVMIGELAGNRARWGFSYLLRFMALFSVNLAVLNMLPIPILDGGHALFLVIEKLRGKPVSEKIRIRLSQVGMILLLLTMVYVTANDGLRLLNIY